MEKECAYFLSIGMTWEQYWHGDPWAVLAFLEAEKLKRQRTSDEAWLYGLYVHDAVAVAVNNALRSKHARAQKYIDRPLRIEPMTEEEKAAEAEAKQEQATAAFYKMMKAWESQNPQE